MRHSLLLAIFFIASQASAVVDMKNANYADTWLDLTIPSAGFDLKVQRTYNSRSLFSGIFGFGWCSDFETKLDTTPEGNLLLTECGAGSQISFYPSSFDGTPINALVDQIMTKARAKNKNQSASYFAKLREQLRNDDVVRGKWAEEVGVRPKAVKEGTIYRANGSDVEKLKFDGKFYERQLADGTKQKFTKDGKLAFVYDRNGNFIKFVYQNDLLKEVVDNNARKLTFTYQTNKRLKEINGPNSLKASYAFKGEDLTSITNAWGNAYTYQYDSGHNLTKISFPDKTAKLITYDQNKDWVTSFKERNGCEEKYQYELSRNDPTNQYSASAVRRCGGKVTAQSGHEFWHRTREDGKKYLHRVKTTGKDDLDVTYHAVHGKPTSIKKDGVLTYFEYFENGLLRQKKSDGLVQDFKYQNDFQKVSEVNSKYLDSKGKPVRDSKTMFQYDKRGNLTLASNSDGQKITLKYDDKGRIASLTDQALKEVLIKYDLKTGKPSQITRPSVGSIVVQYGSNGEMKKAESKDGNMVAMQVASTFNNLLEIIGPATSELNL